MHASVRLLGLLLLAACAFGCVAEDTARPPTPIPVPPTIFRPPLITPSVSPSPSPSPVPVGESYTVRPGDTLSLIAERVYGDANEWRVIFEANRDQLASADALQVGMTIRIPPRSQR